MWIIGRSNVGKSTIINTILNANINKIAKAPGKTNALNFIKVPNLKVTLVDSPGYGFAKRSAKEKNDWNTMMQTYFDNSK